MKALTHSCLEISLTSVVWTFVAFQKNFGINHEFTKYLKKSFGLDIEQHFSINSFLNNCFFREKITRIDGVVLVTAGMTGLIRLSLYLV